MTKERVMIITDTLITVAAIDSLMMNREKDFCWLKAMRRAMKVDGLMVYDLLVDSVDKPRNFGG